MYGLIGCLTVALVANTFGAQAVPVQVDACTSESV
jgi:hypothetical protein